MTKAELRNIARNFLKNHSLSPPVDLERAARSVNAVINTSRHLPDEVSGILIPPAPRSLGINHYIIVVNSRRNKGHQRFTIAHEIAHIILCRPQKCEIFRYPISNLSMEREANIVAAEILMPTDHVTRYVYQRGWKNLDSLCQFYGVSRAAMEVKLQEIGLVAGKSA